MLSKTLRLALVLALGVAGASLAACGPGGGGGNGDGGTGNDGGGNIPPAQQCTNVLNAYCDKINTCAPTLLALEYGDVATCKTALTASCGNYQGNGLANPTACVSAITGATCDDVFTLFNTAPAACQELPGSGAAGATCTQSYNCGASLYCDTTATAGDGGVSADGGADAGCPTGVCTATLAAGASCSGSGICDSRTGVTCVETFSATSSTGGDGAPVCQSIVYGAAGAQCASGTNKQCNGATYCTADHTCAALLAAGATCDPQNSGCDIRQGLFCMMASGGTSYTCQALTIAAVGEACGYDATTSSFTFCVASAYCETGDAGFGGQGTCATRKPQGSSCTDDSQCTFGLTCASDTDPMPGTCQPTAAPACP